MIGDDSYWNDRLSPILQVRKNLIGFSSSGLYDDILLGSVSFERLSNEQARKLLRFFGSYVWTKVWIPCPLFINIESELSNARKCIMIQINKRAAFSKSVRHIFSTFAYFLWFSIFETTVLQHVSIAVR